MLFFTKATCSQTKLVAGLFYQISTHFGLRVNVNKSRVYFSNRVPRRKVNRITFISSIRSTPSLGKYLGFPILKGRVKKDHFNFLLKCKIGWLLGKVNCLIKLVE